MTAPRRPEVVEANLRQWEAKLAAVEAEPPVFGRKAGRERAIRYHRGMIVRLVAELAKAKRVYV